MKKVRTTDAEILAHLLAEMKGCNPHTDGEWMPQSLVEDAFYELRAKKGVRERYTDREGRPLTKLSEDRLFRILDQWKAATPKA